MVKRGVAVRQQNSSSEPQEALIPCFLLYLLGPNAITFRLKAFVIFPYRASGEHPMASIMTMTPPSQRVALLRSVPADSWVAMSIDETKIVAVGGSFAEADKAAKDAGGTDYFITRSPDAWSNRVF
jgi:hypothetical protein